MRNGLVLALFLVAGVAEAAPECLLVRDGESTTQIRTLESGPVVQFAIEEFQKYVKQMSGATVEVRTVTAEPRVLRRRGPGQPPPWASLETACPVTLALEPSLGWDAYRLEISRRSIRVSGGNDRALLYGVYRLLEELGVRFLAPGPDGENVPQRQTLSLRAGYHISRPALRYRGLIVQQPLSAANLQMADWMAKNQMNHWVNPYWVFLSADASLKHRFVEALESRGILWEFGHHTFTQWISQGGFVPDARGWRKGIKTSAAIDISRTVAAEKVARSMAEFVEQWPQVDVLSLWPNDTVDGWCDCESCRLLYGDLPEWRNGVPLMTQPYFWFVDRVEEVLARMGIKQPVTALAYSNTLEPVSNLILPDNVLVTVAPIGRNYSRPIAEVSYFNGIMSEWTSLLGEQSPLGQDGPRVMAYEYYAGQYANNSLPMPSVTALSDDIRDYRQTGFGGISIQAEEGHWGTYALDFYALARMSYHGPGDARRFIADFSRDYYGAAWAPMAEYWQYQEDLMRSQISVRPNGEFFKVLRKTTGAIENLDALVTRAETLADSDIVRARVRFSRLSVDYVKRLRDAVDAGRPRVLEMLPPTPKGVGFLGEHLSGEFVQIRMPLSREGSIGISLGNVVPMSGAGTSYQLEVRRDAVDGPVVHRGGVYRATVDAAVLHIPGRAWAEDNRNPLDITPHLGTEDYERGWLDLFITAHVTGDGWTLYRDHDDGGPWDLKTHLTVATAEQELEAAWQQLEEFVTREARSGIFNGTPEFVLSNCRKMVNEGR